MKKSIAESGGVLIIGLLLSFIFAVPALGWQACGPCRHWDAGKETCVDDCSEEQICCNDSCCSGNCCDDLTCYDSSTRKCCNEGTGHTCPNDDTCCDGECCEVCCSDSGYYCCDSGESCCEGSCYDSQTQGCCDGTVYNLSTQGCCDFLTIYNPSTDKCCYDGLGNTCPDDKICCDGTCCESYQCCIDGQCVDPMCDNCHTVRVTIYECGHSPFDPIGTPCAIDWCIKDVLDTSTCDYDPDSPCFKSDCDTTIDLSKPGEVFQRAYTAACPGGTVTKDIEWMLFAGCNDCDWHGYDSSCKTGSCNGVPMGDGQWRGDAYKCGCP
jgi:hypothetical protein